MKDSLDKINMDIHKISSSLIGNEYTGHVGIVSSLNDIHKQVLKNKDDIEMLKENFALIKWIGSAIGGFVITIIIYIIQKNIWTKKVIDIATELIPETPPKTVAGRMFRWLKTANEIRKFIKKA